MVGVLIWNTSNESCFHARPPFLVASISGSFPAPSTQCRYCWQPFLAAGQHHHRADSDDCIRRMLLPYIPDPDGETQLCASETSSPASSSALSPFPSCVQ